MAMVQVGIVPKDIKPHRNRDNKGADGADYAHDSPGACKQHRDKPQHRRDAVEHRDSLLLAEPQGKQPVVEVPLVRVEGALPVKHTAEKGKGRIRKRHGKRQQRNEEGYQGVELNSPIIDTVDKT